MTGEKLTLHRIWFMTNHEAEQAVERFRLLEDCIDTWAGGDGVAVYTRRTVKWAMLRSLMEDSSSRLPPTYLRPCVIPSPDYVPGALVRLLWYFPGAVAGHTVRVLHLSYSGNEYRYQVMDLETNAVGWIDAAGLEPLETSGGRKEGLR